jgi:hypothetical protein
MTARRDAVGAEEICAALRETHSRLWQGTAADLQEIAQSFTLDAERVARSLERSSAALVSLEETVADLGRLREEHVELKKALIKATSGRES